MQQEPSEYPAQSRLRLVSCSPSDYAGVWPVLSYHTSAICLPHHVAGSPETLHLAIAMLIPSLLHYIPYPTMTHHSLHIPLDSCIIHLRHGCRESMDPVSLKAVVNILNSVCKTHNGEV